jgi:hypothetical protein
MATKHEIAARLAAFGVKLTISQVRKAKLAELQAKLANAERAAKPAARAKRAEPKPAENVVPLRPRASKGINIAPKPVGQIKPCRAGTKQAAIIDALADGATMWELLAVCSRNVSGGTKDWSEASIRSAMYYDVHHVKGYGVRTEVMTPRALYDMGGHEASAEHLLGTEHEHEPCIALYRLVLPAGVSAPLPHTPAREHEPVKKPRTSAADASGRPCAATHERAVPPA